MKRVVELSVLAAVFVLVFAVMGSAQDKGQGEKAIKFTSDVVTGEIVGISKKFISIVYNKDLENGIDYEMLIPIDKDVQVEHKKGLGELKIGDTVSIEYQDTTTEDYTRQRKMKRKATVVSFVRSAPPAPPSQEQ